MQSGDLIAIRNCGASKSPLFARRALQDLDSLLIRYDRWNPGQVYHLQITSESSIPVFDIVPHVSGSNKKICINEDDADDCDLIVWNDAFYLLLPPFVMASEFFERNEESQLKKIHCRDVEDNSSKFCYQLDIVSGKAESMTQISGFPGVMGALCIHKDQIISLSPRCSESNLHVSVVDASLPKEFDLSEPHPEIRNIPSFVFTVLKSLLRKNNLDRPGLNFNSSTFQSPFVRYFIKACTKQESIEILDCSRALLQKLHDSAQRDAMLIVQCCLVLVKIFAKLFPTDSFSYDFSEILEIVEKLAFCPRHDQLDTTRLALDTLLSCSSIFLPTCERRIDFFRNQVIHAKTESTSSPYATFFKQFSDPKFLSEYFFSRAGYSEGVEGLVSLTIEEIVLLLCGLDSRKKSRSLVSALVECVLSFQTVALSENFKGKILLGRYSSLLGKYCADEFHKKDFDENVNPFFSIILPCFLLQASYSTENADQTELEEQINDLVGLIDQRHTKPCIDIQKSYVSFLSEIKKGSQIWETPHPYQENSKILETHTFSGAYSLVIKIDPKTETEYGADFLQFFQGPGETRPVCSPLSGVNQNFPNVLQISGDTVVIKYD